MGKRKPTRRTDLEFGELDWAEEARRQPEVAPSGLFRRSPYRKPGQKGRVLRGFDCRWLASFSFPQVQEDFAVCSSEWWHLKLVGPPFCLATCEPRETAKQCASVHLKIEPKPGLEVSRRLPKEKSSRSAWSALPSKPALLAFWPEALPSTKEFAMGSSTKKKPEVWFEIKSFTSLKQAQQGSFSAADAVLEKRN